MAAISAAWRAALVLSRPPSRLGLGHARRLCAQAAEGIDQVAMAARIDQRPVVVLAVDLDQRLAHLRARAARSTLMSLMKARLRPSAHCTRRRISVASASMPFSASSAKHGMSRGELESRRHLALGRAAPHQRRIASARRWRARRRRAGSICRRRSRRSARNRPWPNSRSSLSIRTISRIESAASMTRAIRPVGRCPSRSG